MRKAKQNHIEQLFDEGTFIYDEVNYDKDFIILNDGDGEFLARVDLDNNQDFIEDSFFIEEKEYQLDELQKEYILEFMFEKFQHEIQAKAERRKEKQETPYHYLNN